MPEAPLQTVPLRHTHTHRDTLKEITFFVLNTNACSVSPTLGGGDLGKDPNNPGQVALQRLLKEMFPKGHAATPPQTELTAARCLQVPWGPHPTMCLRLGLGCVTTH